MLFNEIKGLLDAYHEYRMERMLMRIIIPCCVAAAAFIVAITIISNRKKINKVNAENAFLTRQLELRDIQLDSVNVLIAGKERNEARLNDSIFGLYTIINQINKDNESLSLRVGSLEKDSTDIVKALSFSEAEVTCLRAELTLENSLVMDLLTRAEEYAYVVRAQQNLFVDKGFVDNEVATDSIIQKVLIELGLPSVESNWRKGSTSTIPVDPLCIVVFCLIPLISLILLLYQRRKIHQLTHWPNSEMSVYELDPNGELVKAVKRKPKGLLPEIQVCGNVSFLEWDITEDSVRAGQARKVEIQRF